MRARQKNDDTSRQILLSYEEAATRFALSRGTIIKLARDSNSVVKIGRCARVIAKKLEKYIEDLAG